MAKINVRIRDYSDEYSSIGVNVGSLVSLDTWSIADGEADAFAGHIDAMSLGTVVATYFQQDTQAEDDTRPASPFAQRELGGRVYLKDTVNGKLGYITVPAIDLNTVLTIPGTDLLDPADEPYASFITWLEANAFSPDGNAVTVERAIVVGRNS